MLELVPNHSVIVTAFRRLSPNKGEPLFCAVILVNVELLNLLKLMPDDALELKFPPVTLTFVALIRLSPIPNFKSPTTEVVPFPLKSNLL